MATLPWQRIRPNEQQDWLNQRDDRYGQLVPLAGEPGAIFHTGSNGLVTGRDAWVYNSSGAALRRNVGAMIDFYNEQVTAFAADATRRARTKQQRVAEAEISLTKIPPGSVGNRCFWRCGYR